jgi:hypothetical protein
MQQPSSLPAEWTIGNGLQAGGRGRRSVAGSSRLASISPDSATSHDFCPIQSKRLGEKRKKGKKKRKIELNFFPHSTGELFFGSSALLAIYCIL